MATMETHFSVRSLLGRTFFIFKKLTVTGGKMSNYSKITKQDAENTNDEKLFEGMSNENRELFKRAILDAMESKIDEIDEEIKDIEIPPPSKRHKIRMNRIFRENVGGSFLPFPEVDCFYERVRSKIVVKLNINELIYKCKERRRTR